MTMKPMEKILKSYGRVTEGMKGRAKKNIRFTSTNKETARKMDN